MFKTHFKIDTVKKVYKSYKWDFYEEIIGCGLKNWDLISWFWLIKTTNNKKSEYSQLGDLFFYFGFFIKSVRKYQ